MTAKPIKICGRGHSLCLQKILEASLVEECFADVILKTFSFNHRITKTVKGNKSVLAASSPFLKQLLQDVPREEDAVIIFADYCEDDPSNLLSFVHTGQVACDSLEKRISIENLLEELKIGYPPVGRKKEETRKHLELLTKNLHKDKKKTKRIFKRKKKIETFSSFGPAENYPQYNEKLLEADQLEITLEDPVHAAKGVELLQNPDYYRIDNIEKSCTKYDILPKVDKCSKSSIIDWPRLNDRVGIYFDSQLYSYYQGLVKSLPPIRIFLNVDGADSDSSNTVEKETEQRVKKPKVVYGTKERLTHQNRRKSLSGRFAVKEMCLVNGKRHLTMDGEFQIDPLIQLIDYPKDQIDVPSQGMDQEGEATTETEENNIIQRVIEEESRRKKVLLSTLSRLKKDFSHAKQVAREILKVSRNTEESADDQSAFIRKLCVPTTPKRSAQQVICEVCGKMVTASWIRVHMANHQGERNFLCEHCGRSFASSNLLKSHVHYQHNANLDYVSCQVCSKTFSKKSRLEIHMRIHNGERPFECQECGKKFHTNGNLRKHIMVHSGEKPYKCHLCDKSFAQNTNLRLHLRIHQQLSDMGNSDARIRKPEQVYRCDFCPMTFSRERHFYVHRCTHTGEIPALPCSDCQETFPNINDLKQHKLTEHPGTVHQCHFCDKSFFKKTANIRHMTTHTHGPLPKPSFQCHHCSAQFTTSAARTIHERTHTGERPFQCPNCEKSFSSKYNFRQHLRMHSDERPFQCSSCNKAFRQPQHLRAHSYIHRSQDDPVPCPICGKVFRNKILLMSHKRVHKQMRNDNQPHSSNELLVEKITTNQIDNQASVDSGTLVNIIVLAERGELLKLA